MSRQIIKLNEQQIDWAQKMYAPGGLSARSIALELGVSPNNVANALRRRGVDLNLRSHFASMKAKGRASPMKGAKKTPESIAKQVATRLKNGKPYRSGYKHSDETRKKLSEAGKGKNLKYTDHERSQLKKLRETCKRFIRRIMAFTGKRKTMPTSEYLGYGRAELADRLGEMQSGFEVDHIVPVAEFFRRGITDPAAINALPNLRMLPMIENRKKSDDLPENADELIQLCLDIASGRASYTAGIA